MFVRRFSSIVGVRRGKLNIFIKSTNDHLSVKKLLRIHHMDASNFSHASHKRQFKLTMTLSTCVNLIRLCRQTFHLRKVSHERNSSSSNQKQIGQGVFWRYRGFQWHDHFVGDYCHDCQPHELKTRLNFPRYQPLRATRKGFVFWNEQC